MPTTDKASKTQTKADVSKNRPEALGTVTKDLRGMKNIRNFSQYPLKYLNYAYGYPHMVAGQNYDDCVKMLIIEKQTKYPIYAEAIGDAIKSVIDWVSSGGGLFGPGFGKMNMAMMSQSVQVAAKGYANSRISELSNKASASEYWGRDNSGQNLDTIFKDLFVTETNAGIITYEVPFFSDYWMETDGEAGWKRPGAEALLGKNLAGLAASVANIGFPSTPDWEFSPQYPSVDFEFHLINDTTENLRRHLIWLTSILSGTLYVQVGGFDIGKVGSDQAKENPDEAKSETNQTLFTGLQTLLGKSTSLYKSPNVYEVMVPGRFRWMWSTLSIDVKCIGKIFADTKIKTGIVGYDGSGGGVIGFPEVFKVKMSIRSLVPQAFNTYAYFLDSDSFIGTETNTNTADQQLKDAIVLLFKKTLETMLKAGEIVLDVMNSALDKVLDMAKNMDVQTMMEEIRKMPSTGDALMKMFDQKDVPTKK